MVAHHVSFLEAHVLQAERDHGPFSQTLRRWLGSTGLPSFRNVSISLSRLLPDPRVGRGLRKGEFKGHISSLQTGNGVWLARGGLAQVAGVSESLPQVPLLALSFEHPCCHCSFIHPPFIERLLFAEYRGPPRLTAVCRNSPCLLSCPVLTHLRTYSRWHPQFRLGPASQGVSQP